MSIAPSEPSAVSVKPKLRGVSHQLAFFASIATGIVLVVSANGAAEAWVAAIFAASVTVLFGVSALYHRVQWSKTARARMRRLDHSSIYLLISGTYTPIMWLALDRQLAIRMLAIVWFASILGIILELAVPRAPKWLAAVIYVAIGWVAIFVVQDITLRLGLVAVSLIAAGGFLYTLGAVIYACKWPNPSPRVFGYHEIFHLLVIVGAYLHYAAIMIFALT